MKHKKLLYLFLAAIGILCSCTTTTEEVPEENMQWSLPVSEIKDVMLYNVGAIKQRNLLEDEVSEIVEALAKITISGDGNQSYQNYDGYGFPMFCLVLEDGKELDFSACNPFYIIDAKGYKADYTTCDAISDLYWQLIAKYFPESLMA